MGFVVNIDEDINNMEGLRALIAWANFQYEGFWYPSEGKPRSIKQVVAFYSACKEEGVEAIEDLPEPIIRKISRMRTRGEQNDKRRTG